METLVGVYESDADESIPDTSADIILDLTGEIRSGLDTSNHAALIDKIRYVIMFTIWFPFKMLVTF